MHLRTFFFWLSLAILLVAVSCGIYDGLGLLFSDSSPGNAASFLKWALVAAVAFAVLYFMEQARTYPQRQAEERFEQELARGKHHLRQ